MKETVTISRKEYDILVRDCKAMQQMFIEMGDSVFACQKKMGWHRY